MVVSTSAASSSYFQGGDYVELLSAQGKAPASTWKLQGKIIKSFDKAIKGNAFHMDGSSETKMQLPKAPTPSTSSLGLTQRFLVFQLAVPHTRSFSIEIGFSDFQKIRRRLVFASAFRETTMTALHVQIPISSGISRDQWMNFVFDLQALTEHYFPGSSFRSMESVCISGSCRLKRIFTMKDAPYCGAVEQGLQGHMAAYKQQRLQTKDSANVPISVAGFAEMKDIPKQFVFSVGGSYVPIPTEYFLAISSNAIGAAEAPPALAGRVAGVKPTTSEVKATAAPKPATVKPKTADSRVGRNGDQAKSPTVVGTGKVARTRSGPSARVSEPKAERSIEANQANHQKGPPRLTEPPPTNEYRTRTSPLDHSSQESMSRAAHSTINVDGDDEDKPDADALDQYPDETDMGEGGCIDDLSPAPSQEYQATPPKRFGQTERSVETSLPSATDRKIQRKTVIAEIQSKLDQLTKEAEEEEERDRELFLKSVSIGKKSSARHAPISEDEEISVSRARSMKHGQPVDDWPESELLRSPEPMVLRRMQATKKPEIVFSSSIFNFDRETPVSSESHESVSDGSKRRELFDWDSLLEDSVGSMSKSSSPPVARPEIVPVKISSVLTGGVGISAALQGTGSSREVTKKVSVEEGACDKSTDEELFEMMNARRRARASTERGNGHHESHDAAVYEKHDVRIQDAGAGIASSSVSHSRGRRNSISSDGSTTSDRPHSPVRSEADSDDNLSIDLTDNLGDMDPIADEPQAQETPTMASPSDVTSDDEDSFNFDDLVVCDRDYHPPTSKQPSVGVRQPLARSTDQPSAGPRSSQRQHPINRVRDQTQPRPTTSSRPPQAASTVSPTRKSNVKTPAKVGDASSSAHLMSSSHRRLASLLESTDWSQLPLSSVVPSMPPRSTQEPKTKAVEPPRDKQRAENKVSSSLELIYDPILRCYFDPIGKKYYTLAK